MSGTVALVISTGWGVRTFLQSDVLPALLAHRPVLVLAHPRLQESLEALLDGRATVAPLRPFDPRDGRFGDLSRRHNRYFHHLSSTVTRRFNRAAAWPSWRRQPALAALAQLKRLEVLLRARPGSLARLAAEMRDAFAREYPHGEHYRSLFAEHRVGTVVSTVAYLPIEAPPIFVARQQGLATGCWVNSWDNLTSKGALLTDFDRYFVWSEQMAGELRRYYRETRRRPIEAVGVPHFDWYRAPAMRWSRLEWCRRLGLDPARPVVLYGAATPFLAPDEQLVAEALHRDLEEAELPGRPQLVVRLHPADDGRRFAELARRDGVALQVPGAASAGHLSAFVPSDDDNRLQVNTMAHADVVVNIASTMTLEAALCDRPVVCVGYDLAPGRPAEAAIRQYYGFDHFRTVLALGAAPVADDRQALLERVRAYLEHPERDRAGRRRLADLWCSPWREGAGQRLAAALLAMTEAGAERAAEGS